MDKTDKMDKTEDAFYIVNAINGSSVLNSFHEELLLVVYAAAIESYKISPDNSLLLDSRISLNAKVSCAAFVDSKLLILTEKCELLTLQKGQTLSCLDLKEISGRSADGGHLIIADPGNKVIGCYMYQGLCKIIPMSAIQGDKGISESKKGKRKIIAGHEYNADPFNVRLKELLIVDMVFLSTLDDPCLVILHQDSSENLHIISYTVNLINKTLLKSTLISESALNKGFNKLIPLTGKLKGWVLVIGQDKFLLLSRNDLHVVYECSECQIITAWEWLDPDHLLLVDHTGALGMLEIRNLDEKWNYLNLGIVRKMHT